MQKQLFHNYWMLNTEYRMLNTEWFLKTTDDTYIIDALFLGQRSSLQSPKGYLPLTTTDYAAFLRGMKLYSQNRFCWTLQYRIYFHDLPSWNVYSSSHIFMYSLNVLNICIQFLTTVTDHEQTTVSHCRCLQFSFLVWFNNNKKNKLKSSDSDC